MAYTRIMTEYGWKIIGEADESIVNLAWNAERAAPEAIAPLPADIIALLAGQAYLPAIEFYEAGMDIPTLADNWQKPAEAALVPGQALADERERERAKIIFDFGKTPVTPSAPGTNGDLVILAGAALLAIGMTRGRRKASKRGKR